MTSTERPRDRAAGRAAGRARHRRRTPSFYERALDAADRDLLAEALVVEGVDQEVALLRLQVLRLLEEQPEDPRVLQSGIRLLVQALVARHRLTGREAETLTETASGLLEQFAALFAPLGEDGRA